MRLFPVKSKFCLDDTKISVDFCHMILDFWQSIVKICHGFSAESGFQGVKQALHTAVPERLLSREAERAAIVSFLENHVVAEKPSSLYISGAPGTGKTACLNCVLQEQKVKSDENTVHLQLLGSECVSIWLRFDPSKQKLNTRR